MKPTYTATAALRPNSALLAYRALSKAEKLAYVPRKGAPDSAAVRELQALAGEIVRGTARHHYNEPMLQRDANQHVRVLPIGEYDAAKANTHARALYPRKKNWTTSATNTSKDAVTESPIYYRGAHRGRVGSYFSANLFCVARTTPSCLGAVIGDKQHALKAPRGYTWGTDTNGIRLVRTRDGADYHPNTDDVGLGVKHIVDRLNTLALRRAATAQTTAREAKILAKAVAHGVWVCLADSLTAGNCRAGTLGYAQRHKLNTNKHYLVAALPIANPEDARRVALVALMAQRRQAREMHAGMCAI